MKKIFSTKVGSGFNAQNIAVYAQGDLFVLYVNGWAIRRFSIDGSRKFDLVGLRKALAFYGVKGHGL